MLGHCSSLRPMRCTLQRSCVITCDVMSRPYLVQVTSISWLLGTTYPFPD